MKYTVTAVAALCLSLGACVYFLGDGQPAPANTSAPMPSNADEASMKALKIE